jgi:hypothetical protein
MERAGRGGAWLWKLVGHASTTYWLVSLFGAAVVTALASLLADFSPFWRTVFLVGVFGLALLGLLAGTRRLVSHARPVATRTQRVELIPAPTSERATAQKIIRDVVATVAPHEPGKLAKAFGEKAARDEAERKAREATTLADRLARLYHDGTRARTNTQMQAIADVSLSMQGRLAEVQIDRERAARRWNAEIRSALASEPRLTQAWDAAGEPPAEHPTRRQIQPTSTRGALAEFYSAKLKSLTTIIERLNNA